MNRERPRIIDDEMYQLIREGKFEEFNEKKQSLDKLEFIGCDFRGIDLRKFNLENVNFSDSYFRGADLRGIDLRTTTLDGASLAKAKISGTYFPDFIEAMEIELSINHGTRLRCKP